MPKATNEWLTSRVGGNLLDFVQSGLHANGYMAVGRYNRGHCYCSISRQLLEAPIVSQMWPAQSFVSRLYPTRKRKSKSPLFQVLRHVRLCIHMVMVVTYSVP